MYQFLQALNDYYQLIFRLHTIFAANSYFIHKEGVVLVYLCSNQVCDNLRIARNTSPHPFLCADVSRYSVVPGSQFGSIRAF